MSTQDSDLAPLVKGDRVRTIDPLLPTPDDWVGMLAGHRWPGITGTVEEIVQGGVIVRPDEDGPSGVYLRRELLPVREPRFNSGDRVSVEGRGLGTVERATTSGAYLVRIDGGPCVVECSSSELAPVRERASAAGGDVMREQIQALIGQAMAHQKELRELQRRQCKQAEQLTAMRDGLASELAGLEQRIDELRADVTLDPRPSEQEPVDIAAAREFCDLRAADRGAVVGFLGGSINPRSQLAAAALEALPALLRRIEQAPPPETASDR